MDYRDQAGGDPNLWGSQPIGRGDDGGSGHVAGLPQEVDRAYPTDRHHRPVTDHRTPSRRRAVARGRAVPADGYLPYWVAATGAAGHATPPTTEPTSSWREVTETTSWSGSTTTAQGRPADHTAEWRQDRYSGYRGPAEADAAGHERERHAGPGPVDWQDWTSGDNRWDRNPAPGSWHTGETPARWSDEADHGQLPAWSDRTDGFWSGTRLAGDDPRWMATPTSAPRSPAVGWPPPNVSPTPAGTPDGARSTVSPERAGTVPERPAESVPPVAAVRGTTRRDLSDQDEAEQVGGVLASVFYTVACYVLPVALLVGWLFTLDDRVPAGCVTDVTGGGCTSPRAFVLESMLSGAQQFGLALVTSMLVAVVLRWLSGGWRAASVGLAASVVGGGLATLLHSAISGQPLS